jgi:1-acyl-sn-glycerol-3-phosphate acyltransferase
MTRLEHAPGGYRFAAGTLRWGARLLRWDIRFTGLEHLPLKGPAIVVANHVSYVDPILLGLGVEARGRMVRFLAKRELFDHWFTGPVMRHADQILVDRRGDAHRALRHAEQAMAEGKLLVIFPEATIHPVFDPARGKTGAARLALTTGAPLIPAVAWGGQDVATKHGRRRPGWRSIHEVRFGPPLPYSGDDSPADLTVGLMAAIAELLVSAADAHPLDLGAPVLTPQPDPGATS